MKNGRVATSFEKRVSATWIEPIKGGGPLSVHLRAGTEFWGGGTA